MTEIVSLMDIDDDDSTNPTTKATNKAKNAVVSTTAAAKAAPWVEKYRPQSLADVAAHRDIVDTSELFRPHFPIFSLPRVFFLKCGSYFRLFCLVLGNLFTFFRWVFA